MLVAEHPEYHHALGGIMGRHWDGPPVRRGILEDEEEFEFEFVEIL